MLFNSFIFVGLFLVTFVLYYLPFLTRWQVHLLILSSLLFYAYGDPALVLLLLFSAGINVATSYYIVTGKAKKKKALVLAGVISNLLILAFFKYSPLIGATFFDTNDSVGRFLLHMPLPIGISFFTFEGISLLVDVYSGKYDNAKIVSPSMAAHAKRTLFFISFFPHLIAGPILKAHDIFPQIRAKKLIDINRERAFKALVLGYFLKMVVADNLKDFTASIIYPEYQSSLTLVAMLFGYSFQIFADFAGYSLIAIGLAKLFGYDFMDNFSFPYISTSFREFWKRWHISLSTFLMEYLYFPLGGNRKGKVRTYINLIITMVLGGLWHGAAWSYALWGGFHGLALAGERLITGTSKIKRNRVILFLKGFFVFSFVTVAWLLFKLPDFNDVTLYFNSVFSNFRMPDNTTVITYIFLYSLPVIMYHAFYLLKDTGSFAVIKKYEFIPYAIMLFLIITNSGTSGAFIYFQF